MSASLAVDETTIRISLSDDAFALLLELAEACHAEPRAIAAAILTDVLLDDAMAHQVHAGVDRELLH